MSKSVELEAGTALLPRYDANGLIPAIVSDMESGEVLMMAYMNALALEKSIETGQSHFWSRSRQELWHKGATSGDYQFIEEMKIDCDQDTILLKVRMAGNAACHTGRRSCFYRKVQGRDGNYRLSFDSE